MSNYDMISIENVSCEDVRRVLFSQLGIKLEENNPCYIMGMTIDVQDLKNEIEYAVNFLESEGLQEEHPFYNEFDMTGFNVVVEVQSRYLLYDVRPVISDAIGKLLSSKLKTRVVIALNNGEIPFCIYDNGIKVKDMKKYYKKYFNGKSWCPVEMKLSDD